MDLICIENFEEFQNFQKEWDELLSRSSNGHLFLTHDWLSTWWMSYGRQKDLFVLLLWENNRLIGAVPMMMTKDNKYGVRFKRIAFMGDSEWTINDFIISDKRNEAIEKIIKFLLSREWDIVDLRNIPESSKHVDILSKEFGENGFNITRHEAAKSPVLTIGGKWEDFYNSRSTKFKKTTRNKINRINKSGNVSIEKYSKPDEVAEILPVVFDIGLKGWKHRQTKNAISSTEQNRRFYSRLAGLMSAEGRLDIWLLRWNEIPIAFEFHVRYENTIHALTADYDERYQNISPGSVLDYNIMQHMFQSRIDHEYDMGSGENFYKMHWTDETKKHVRIYCYNNTICGKLLLALESKVLPYAKMIRNTIRGVRG